jgi:hypothetical protein
MRDAEVLDRPVIQHKTRFVLLPGDDVRRRFDATGICT